jgi:hypothetical protein
MQDNFHFLTQWLVEESLCFRQGPLDQLFWNAMIAKLKEACVLGRSSDLRN